MFSFNRAAMLAAAVSFGLILLFSLLFAFRDTLRGFREVFDVRLLRTAYRSVVGTKRGFSLAIGALITLLLAIVAWLVVNPGAVFLVCAVAFGAYATIAVGSTLYLFAADAFRRDPWPRRRWGNRRIRPPDDEPPATSSGSKPSQSPPTHPVSSRPGPRRRKRDR